MVSLAACTSSASTSVQAAPPQSAQATTSQSTQAAAIAKIVQNAMRTDHLKAVVIKVTKGGNTVTTQAFGDSIDGVPATTAMHFRNGAVAFEYVATLLMEFVDEHKVTLNDTIERWMPTLPEAGKVTLKMLANQTTGYPDFETDPAWLAAFNAAPFHVWTFNERLKYAFARPVQFAPGANWSYSHTNFMILGEILAKIGHEPLDTLLREKVLDPMGLTSTTSTETSDTPSPVLHSFSSERRVALGIPPGRSFYEEATFWNAQWGTPIGANETTDINDMSTTAVEVGTGALLSRSSYHAMTDPNLPGFGHAQPNCAPSCFEQTNIYNFGLGVVRSGSWLVQDPLLSGEGSTEAYLPAQKIAISAVVTFLPGAFDAQGNYSNFSEQIFQALGAYLAPDDAPPSSRLAGHGEGLGSHVAARRVLTVVLTGMESRQAAVRSLTGRRRKLEFWMAGGR
jgi:CubicO group peptidase (beta-lactamase class C family)